jgi:hypothetical protein
MSFESRTRRGVRAPNASLSDPEVEWARELWEEDYTLKQIKSRLELSCSLQTIWNAVTEKTYKKGVVDFQRLSNVGRRRRTLSTL